MATPQDAISRLLGRKTPDVATPDVPDLNPQNVLERLRAPRDPLAEAQPTGETIAPLPKPKPSVADTLPQDELGLSLQTASQSDPATAARRTELAKRLERNPELVTDINEAEQEVFLRENDPQDLQNRHPAIARYLREPQNAQLVGRNLDPLKEIDNTFRRFVTDPIVSAGKGVIGIEKAIVGTGALIESVGWNALPEGYRAAIEYMMHASGAGAAREKVAEAIKSTGLFDLDAAEKLLDSLYTPEQQEVNKTVAESKGFLNTIGTALEHPSFIGHAIIESLGPMALSGKLGRQMLKEVPTMAPAVAGALGEGVVIAGSTAYKIQSETPDGELSAGQALAATGAGLAGFGIGTLGAKIAQKVGITDIDTAIVTGSLERMLTASKMPQNIAVRIITGGTLEGFEEMGQSAVETIAENVALGKPWDEGVPEAAALGLVTGTAMGGPTQVFAKAPRETLNKAIEEKLRDNLTENIKASTAVHNRDLIQQLSQQTADNPLRKESPESFRQFIRTMVDENEGALQEVYVDPVKLEEAFMQSGTKREELAQKLPDVVRELEDARVTGAEVRIPIEDYATYIAGTPVENAIIDSLRTEPEGMTYTEAQEFQKQQGEIFAQQAQELEATEAPVLTREQLAADAAAQKTTPVEYREYLKRHPNRKAAFQVDKTELQDRILTGLAEANRFTRTTNKVYAVPFAEFFATNAARMGLLPSELYDRLPLNFRNTSMEDIGGQLTQDPPDDPTLGPTEGTTQEGAKPEVNRPGGATAGFFTKMTKGETGVPRGDYTPVLNLEPKHDKFNAEYIKHRGNFDNHIRASIPGFTDVQAKTGSAIVGLYNNGAKVLDIGASEGSWAKSITALSEGRIETDSLEPLEAMANTFNQQSQVPGARHLAQAWGDEGWTEEDTGFVVSPFQGGTYDVIHEAMTFQFINNNREEQVARVKRHLADGGVFLTEEKFADDYTSRYAQQEARKDQYKAQYFTSQEIAEKKEETLVVGMDVNMVREGTYEDVLTRQFKHVAKYWTSGNFGGYVASDDPVRLKAMVDTIGDTQSEFSNRATLEDFTQDGISGILQKNDWLIITAETTAMNARQKAAATKKLKKDLQDAGYEFNETLGRYEGESIESKGFLVFGVDPIAANELGNKYGQDSVLINRGLLYGNRDFTPHLDSVRTFATKEEGYAAGGYTFVAKTGVIFQVDLDPTFRKVKPDSLNVTGVHYSMTARPILDGSKFGTGMAGAETERLFIAEDDRIRQRVDFYVNTGDGVTPETGLGPVLHTVRLDNIYDASVNNKKYRVGFTPQDLNAFESKLLDEGYDGYLARQRQPGDTTGKKKQGRVVVLGERSTNIPARPHISKALYQQALSGQAGTQPETISETISVNGVERPTRNSNNELIHPTEEGVRNFWEWFGDSKVVDSSGRPLVVYHGTDKRFSKVNLKKGAQGLFWFTSDLQAIEEGDIGAAGRGVVMQLYAKILNPAGWRQYDQLMLDEFESRGLDGAVLPEEDGKLSGFIISEPNQIKSAIGNTGVFSLVDSNILRQPLNIFNPDTGEVNYDIEYETRPGTTQKQKNLARSVYADMVDWLVSRQDGTLLGLQLAEDFKRQGAASLIGQTALTSFDLAAMAQILRDPRYETFRIFYTDAKGTILHHDSMSSRLPAAVTVGAPLPGEAPEEAFDRFAKNVADTMERTGAAQYFMLHNHPSGKSTPSHADEGFTMKLANAVPGFRTHVVINSNEFSRIDSDGVSETIEINYTGMTYGWGASIPHDLLNKTILDPESILRLGKTLEMRDGFFYVVGRNAQGRVTTISDIPYTVLDQPKVKQLATLREYGRRSGATEFVALVHTNKMPMFDDAMQNGILLDVIGIDTGVNHPRAGGRQLYGSRRSALRTVQEEQTAAYDTDPLGFYSPFQRALPGLRKIASKQGLVKPDQAIAWVKARQGEGKFKKEEVEAIGIIDFLTEAKKSTDALSVDYIESYVDENGLKLREARSTDVGIKYRVYVGAGMPHEDYDDYSEAERRIQELDDQAGESVQVSEDDDTISLYDNDELDTEFTREESEEGELWTLTRLYGSYPSAGSEDITFTDREGALNYVYDRESELRGMYFEGVSSEPEQVEGDESGTMPSMDFSTYTLNDNNYREVLLTLPPEVPYKFGSSHFGVPNIVAHMRTSDLELPTSDLLTEAENKAAEEKFQADMEEYHRSYEELKARAQPYLTERTRTREIYESYLETLDPSQRDLPPGLRSPLPPEVAEAREQNIQAIATLRELGKQIPPLPQKPRPKKAKTRRILFLEEIQSDWAQKGREKGFALPEEARVALANELIRVNEEMAPLHVRRRELLKNDQEDSDEFAKLVDRISTLEGEAARLRSLRESDSDVARAPFVTETKSWVSLVLKRAMRMAADEGYDGIAWTRGDQQAARYDLRKQLSAIQYSFNEENKTYRAVPYDMQNRPLHRQELVDVPESELEGIVGKDIALQMKARNGIYRGGTYRLTGDNLAMGGEGMIAFYDRIVPQVAAEVQKRLGTGTKVEMLEFEPDPDSGPDPESVGTQPGILFTDRFREKVSAGMPLFQDNRAMFNPDTFTMTLLKGSDLSSVIHEGGHFYLEAMAAIAKMPEATDQQRADFNTTMGWFGVNPDLWYGMTLDEKREHHEQWAQSFERYSLEGRAPTTAMQPVFARFRTWMLSVYKSLTEFLKNNPLAGKLNDDVRQVFDRLLASEEAIQEAEEARGYAPLFKTAEEAGLTPKQFQEYLDLGEAATQQGLDQLSARSLRDMKWTTNAQDRILRELQRKARDQRKAIRDQVTEEVQSEPVYRAVKFFLTGDYDDGEGTTSKIEAFKLNRQAVKDFGGDANTFRGMLADDGVDPDLAAQLLGFGTGAQLLKEISERENLKQKIDGVTEQRMLAEHGELSDERSMKEAAQKAIHNEARTRFMATGLKMLLKAKAPAHQIVTAAKQAADTAIAKRLIRDIKPKQYEAAETKAGRDALSAVKDDPRKAVEAQRAALLNNRLAKSAAEAVEEVNAILKHLAKFANQNTRKNLDLEYMEQIDDLLQGFDFNKSRTLIQIDKNQSLADWIENQEANGFEPAIDPELMEEVKRKHYKNMTLDELRGLSDTVKQIEHMGRLRKKLLTLKEREAFAQVVESAAQSIETNANRTVKERATPTDVIGITMQWARQMLASHRKFNSIIREMDGGKDGGRMWEILSRGMNAAGDKETTMKAAAAEKLAELFNKMPRESVPLNLYAKRMSVPGTDIAMTHEQRIMFALNWGNEGNRQRLLDGGLTGKKALSMPEAERILDTLTKNEWDFVQSMWDYIGSYKDQVAALERRLTGVEPKWVDSAPVETRYGTYRGGYFPIKYDAQMSTRSESLEAATDLRMGMKGAFQAAATRNGYTKARADQVVNRPVLLSYNVISQHIGEVAHRLSWQPWLVDSNRLLRALDTPIRTHYGPDILRELRDTVTDIAAGDAPAKNPTEKALNHLRMGSTIVGMGWRFSTAAMQLTGMTQSWARIGGRWAAKGIGQFVTSPLDSSAFVKDKSPFMTARARTMNREINEVLNTIRAGEKVSALTSSYFTMITKMQLAVDIPTWLGAYEKGLAQGKYENATDDAQRKEIEDRAVALADQAVLDSQSGGQIKDLAKVQRGSPLFKLFTNFYSYFSAAYNLNIETVRRTNFRSPTEIGIALVDLTLINILPVMMTVGLKMALKGGCEPDDLECITGKYVQEQLGHFSGQLILLREMGAAISAATGEQTYGYQGPAGLRFFNDFYKAGVQIGQGEADLGLFKSVNSVGGMLLHYPAGQINTTLDGILAIEDGRVEGMAILPALLAGKPQE